MAHKQIRGKSTPSKSLLLCLLLHEWCLLHMSLTHVMSVSVMSVTCVMSVKLYKPPLLAGSWSVPFTVIFPFQSEATRKPKNLTSWFLFASSVPDCSSLMPIMVFSGCCQSKHIMTRKMEHHDTKYPLQQLELGAKQEQHHHLYQYIQKKPRTDLGSVHSASHSE